MDLNGFLNQIKGITNTTIDSNCFEGQYNVLEGLQQIQSKINEVIDSINQGVIKGDKGDKGDNGQTPVINVGTTTQLNPEDKAIVSQTGTPLNMTLNFGIPKGEKGEKGDPGNARIDDTTQSPLTTWSSEKIFNQFNDLKDIQGVNYTTDKNYLVMNGTKNGVVKDLKVFGKSWVNLSNSKDITRQFNQTIPYEQISRVETNKMYTVGVLVTKNTCNTPLKFSGFEFCGGAGGVALEGGIKDDYTFCPPNTIGFFTFKVGVKTFGTNGKNCRLVIFNNGATSGEYTVSCVLVEGEQNLNGYFEGIASVGNGNEIEVLSCGKNLLKPMNSGKLIVIPDFSKITFSNEHSFSYNATDWGQGLQVDVEGIIKGETYYIICDDKQNGVMRGFDGLYTPNDIYFTNNKCEIKATSSGKASIVFKNSVQNGLISFTNIRVVKKGSNEEYDVFKQDKKPILFKDVDGNWKPVTELRGISNSAYDTIESSKYNKKLDEIILDETLNYTLWKPNPNAVNTIMFSLSNVKIKRGSQFSPISNLLVNRIGVPKEPISTFKDLDKEGIGYWDSTVSLFVSINKSQLETPDVTGFKKLLKKWKDEGQPLKVIYEKESYEQYEVNPLDLESFENETMILFNTDVISPNSSFYVDSNLGSITLNILDRMSRVENEVFQVKKIVLNGDYRLLAEMTYPNDFINESEDIKNDR